MLLHRTPHLYTRVDDCDVTLLCCCQVGSDLWGGMSATNGLPEGQNVYGRALMIIRDELRELLS